MTDDEGTGHPSDLLDSALARSLDVPSVRSGSEVSIQERHSFMHTPY